MPADQMPQPQEKRWVPTRGQKIIATIEELIGKMMSNQARILESRTTRTGVPYGPGGTVSPPASFFAGQPPNIGRSDYMTTDSNGQRLKSVNSSTSDRTAVSGLPSKGESKNVHGVGTGLGGGHHGGMNGNGKVGKSTATGGHGRKRREISG